MKLKYSTLILISMFFVVAANCQHQLYFETFNGISNSFTINDNELGNNKGNNKWIIDTNYFAGGLYPNTVNESFTYGGSITAAPHSQYLHIYDSASTYKDDNYNPNDSSTRFAHMTDGICTKSLTGIAFNFYYLNPSKSSYGTVWYSIDGGTWTSTGDTLENRQKWQYETITNPAFRNVDNLRLGFLWHNKKAASIKDTGSLGIDDVSLYGSYDSIAHPITCHITNFFSDSCLGGSGYVYFETSINDSTCNAVWDAYMSDGNGNFPGPYGWYQTVADSLGNDLNQYWFLEPPGTFNTPGHCYKFKVVRTSYPYLTFLDSVCFPFDSCPGYITTIDPPALDSHISGDTVCAGSVVDIGFYSSGIYSPFNIYYAELIDSIGHTAKIDTIGQLVSNTAYVYPPGDVVSTIPDSVPAGCNYYVRIVSSTPNRTPNIWGPFCIQHCDILTNKQQGLQVCLQPCITQPHGYYDTISYNVHEYDSLEHYHPGNQFKVQLIAFSIPLDFFTIVNTGLLGVVFDTTSGKMLLHVPCPDTLFMNGIKPGIYYARIIATNSNFPDSTFGTLIHIAIGEPADNMSLSVTPNTNPYCLGATITFKPVPDDGPDGNNNGSTYTWWITDKTQGTLEFQNYPYDYLGYTPATSDTFEITCQENSFGCLGAKVTLPDTIIIIGKPLITKKGPTTICLGDTGTYSIPFENATNYEWKISAPAHADTSTNVLKIRFDTTGTVKVTVLAFNSCFTDSAVWNVTIVAKPKPTITAVPSTSTICAGTSVTFTASAAGATGYLWDNGKRTSSIVVVPTSDTSYSVGVSNRGCTVQDTVRLTVLPRPAVNVSYCVGDSVILNATGAKSYSWLPPTGLIINDSIAKDIIPSIQTFTVIGTTNGCTDTVNVSVNPSLRSDTITKAVAISPGQSVALTVQGGNSWLWSPSSSLNNDTLRNPIATPATTTIYTVVIRNSSGCTVTDTVTVDVDFNCDIWVPNIFSPSDANNHNTILYARSECLVTIDFTVFDRWGNKVFESLDINKGWDGNFGGKPLNSGVFVYYVTGKNSDGKTLEKKGNVTLVR